MLWNIKDKAKSYNIIIIPEKGGKPKYLNLTRILLRTGISITGVIIAIVVAYNCYSAYYNKQLLIRMRAAEEAVGKDITLLDEAKQYIRALEKDNKQKDQTIESYRAYEEGIKERMSKIDELEKAIDERLKKSELLSDEELRVSQNTVPVEGVYEFKNMAVEATPILSADEIDDKITTLENIRDRLDLLLEREAYQPSLMPCQGRITSKFGERANPFSGYGSEGHNGIDIAASRGTKIHATAKGTVIYAEYQNGYGNVVYISHGNGLVSLYGHASELLVEEGETVEKGEVIALVGSTGRSTGPHVHFEIRKNGSAVNPYNILLK